MNTCYLYVLSSRDNRHLCVKSTCDLRHGVRSHRRRISERLGKRNLYQKVVLVERFDGLTSAVERERELAGWSRARLGQLVTRNNPTWKPVSIRRYLAKIGRSVQLD